MELDDRDNWFWLAGLLEGEGSFQAPRPSKPNSPTVSVEMNDRDVLERVGALLGMKVQTRRRVRYHQRRRRLEEITVYRVTITGTGAVRLMWALQPYMSARRQEQIETALASYSAKSEKKYEEIHRPFVLMNVCSQPMCPNEAINDSRRCEAH